MGHIILSIARDVILSHVSFDVFATGCRIYNITIYIQN